MYLMTFATEYNPMRLLASKPHTGGTSMAKKKKRSSASRTGKTKPNKKKAVVRKKAAAKRPKKKNGGGMPRKADRRSPGLVAMSIGDQPTTLSGLRGRADMITLSIPSLRGRLNRDNACIIRRLEDGQFLVRVREDGFVVELAVDKDELSDDVPNC